MKKKIEFKLSGSEWNAISQLENEQIGQLLRNLFTCAEEGYLEFDPEDREVMMAFRFLEKNLTIKKETENDVDDFIPSTSFL